VKKRLRLTRQRDFQRILGGAAAYRSSTLVCFGLVGSRSGLQVGVAASRQIKGSVSRNRVKRRLREAVRIGVAVPRQNLLSSSHQVVLIARPAALERPFEQLVRDAAQAFARIVPEGR